VRGLGETVEKETAGNRRLRRDGISSAIPMLSAIRTPLTSMLLLVTNMAAGTKAPMSKPPSIVCNASAGYMGFARVTMYDG
jgi:hypothetical protein